MSEEPVAYLGGDTGPQDDDPYAPPPKASPAAADDEEVSGYLGGAAAEEDLPSLPPAEEKGSYVAKDLLEREEPEPEAADPYADPYATANAEQPAAEPSTEYGDYETPAVSEADQGYFDSMGHSGEGEMAMEAPAEAPAEGYSDDEADSPKTISQQDAESIIRRITTKRILPPEAEKKSPAASTKLTEARSGAPVGPIILVVLLLGAFGVYLFAEQIAEAVPELRPLFFWLDPPPVVEVAPVAPVEDPQAVAKRQLLALILKSEAKAFGVPEKDIPPAAGGAKPPGGATPPAGGPTTPPAGTGTTPPAPGGG